MPMIKDPRWVAINLDGTPAAGAKMFVYDAGTDNEEFVYADEARSTIIKPVADGRGFFPVFFGVPGKKYKIRIESANGSLICEIDNVVCQD